MKAIEKAEKQAKKEHSLNLSTRLQFLYTFKSYENKAGKDDTSEFNIRRMRFQADGSMYKDVDYKFEFSADKMQAVSLKDAWVGFKYIPYARIRMGQFKTPFSRQRITSSSKLQIIERSPIQVLYPGRDLGVEVSGKNIGGMFDYAAAMLSGVGDKRKFSDTDNSRFFTDGRLAFHPLGSIKHSEGDVADTPDFRFEVAGNFLYAPRQVAFGEKSSDKMFNTFTVYNVPKTKNEVIDGVTVVEELDESGRLALVPLGDTYNVGPELTIIFKGFSLAAEAYWAQFNPDSTEEWKIKTKRRTIRTMGYFIQGGAFVIPKTLELTGRFDYLDIDTEQQDDKDDLKAYTAGLNYFVSEDHKYKLQANFTRELRDGKHNLNSNTIMINAQIKY